MRSLLMVLPVFIVLAFWLPNQTQAAGKSALTLNEAWSENKSPSEGIREAVAGLKTKGVEHPKLVITYFTETYQPEEVSSVISKAFPGTHVYGQTVYMGTFTSTGLHIGRNGSIAMLSYEGDGFTAGVMGAEIETETDVTKLAQEVAKKAIDKSGHKESEMPSLVILGAKRGNEEVALKGLNQVFSKETPMMGGTPSTNSFGAGAVIADDKAYLHGLGVAVLYSQGRSGSAFYSGFEKGTKTGVVTESSGRLLKKIDGRSAQAVYKEWTGGHFDAIKPVKEDIATLETAAWPFAKRFKTADDKSGLIFIRAQKFTTDGGLILGAEIFPGDELSIVETNQATFIQRAGSTAEKAEQAGKLRAGELAGGVHIYCAGASTLLGVQRNEPEGQKMVKSIADAMPGKPFIGGFTSAEQGSIKGVGFVNSNLMSVMTVFGK